MRAMKEAMYSISHTGEFRFSDFDFDPNQLSLVEYGAGTNWEEKAAEELYKLAESNGILNKAIPAETVIDWVILYTKYVYKRPILEYLERTGKIEVIGERKQPFTYPKRKVIIKFK